MRAQQHRRSDPYMDDQDDDEIYTPAPRRPVLYKPRPNDAIYSGPPPPVLRKSRAAGQPAHVQAARSKSFIVGKPAPVQTGQRMRFHWMVYAGVVLMIGIIGWLAITIIGTIWQSKVDDWTYGTPRTYQTDAIVMPNDSASHPSHFIAENIHGQIIVIDYPSGDVSKARSYVITTLPDNNTSVPVRLVFQDVNGDGRLDMLVLIGDPGTQLQIILYNTGTEFASKL